MMSILGTIFIGLIVGFIARAIKPGDDKLGWIMTAILGVAGSFLAGYAGKALGFYQAGQVAGFAIAACSFLLGVVYGVMKVFGFPFPLGNPTIVILMLLLGGIQLISVGILGSYVARIYDEVKRRPKFIVDRAVGFDAVPASRNSPELTVVRGGDPVARPKVMP